MATRLAQLVLLLAFPMRAAAQTAGTAPSGRTPGSSSWGGSAAIVAVVLLVLVATGVTVGVVDRKHKREDEALPLQAQISDALMLDRSLTGLPIAAVADGSLWRRSPVVIAITGTVATPEQRETVMRLVAQELSRRHPFAREADRSAALMQNPEPLR